MLSEKEKTSCYTYEITMIVQVFAESLEKANFKVDSEGGYVSERTVAHKKTTDIYNQYDDDKGKTEV
jgi:hypothetical protein